MSDQYLCIFSTFREEKPRLSGLCVPQLSVKSDFEQKSFFTVFRFLIRKTLHFYGILHKKHEMSKINPTFLGVFSENISKTMKITKVLSGANSSWKSLKKRFFHIKIINFFIKFLGVFSNKMKNSEMIFRNLH